MNDPRLEATGNCYEEAAELLVDPFNRDYANWTLVHGRPVRQRPPHIRYDHAWLEKDGVAYDPTTDTTLPVDAYYRLGQITTEGMHRYNRREARRKIVEFEHWGPWDGEHGCPPMGMTTHTEEL